MRALTIIHRLGELLDPCGHYRCGRAMIPGAETPTGPYVAAWTKADPWRYLCSAVATSPDLAAEELAEVMLDLARVQADTWERDPARRNRAGEIRIALMELAVVRAALESAPSGLRDKVVDGIERMRSRGEL